jgi:hypothetical protein
MDNGTVYEILKQEKLMKIAECVRRVFPFVRISDFSLPLFAVFDSNFEFVVFL